jgi:hypothetical protein
MRRTTSVSPCRDLRRNKMIGEKVRHFKSKNTDLAALKGKIEDYLRSEGFTIQSSKPSIHGAAIQAQKGGFLTSIISADRALTILIDGEPGNFTVRVGIGRWLRHLSVTAVEALFLSELFLFVDVPEMIWNIEVENKVVKKIDALVG